MANRNADRIKILSSTVAIKGNTTPNYLHLM